MALSEQQALAARQLRPQAGLDQSPLLEVALKCFGSLSERVRRILVSRQLLQRIELLIAKETSILAHRLCLLRFRDAQELDGPLYIPNLYIPAVEPRHGQRHS